MNAFLIVRLGSLGDVIHAIPAAAALRARYPDARIDWMVDPRYVELLNLVTGLDHRIPLDPRHLLRGNRRAEVVSTLRDLRRVQYDAVIDLQGLLKSGALARLVGARRTVGFPKTHLREPAARFFYTQTPDPGSLPHVVYKNLALVASLGVEDLRVRFPIDVPVTAAVEAVSARLSAYALVNPGAAWPNKRWPAARFGALAARIARQHGLRSLVLWGPGEQALAQAVVDASRGSAELSPETSIVDIAGLARGARLMVSGDTGPLHIAGAVGTPLVALFGPTDPARNGPWSPDDVTVSRLAQCVCQYERTCRRETPCIDDIGVDEVMDAIGRRMRSRV